MALDVRSTSAIEAWWWEWTPSQSLRNGREAGDWRVEYFDDDGGCYVTVFAGPEAERRARDYADALKAGVLKQVMVGPAARVDR